MFGEAESESPRVPSPWDSLMSRSPSPISGQKRSYTPIPLVAELVPKLVPESDDGNVEYKLQLLNPSPARFARLVTQMKWRLLEGGGQAYYELGVADSGDLVGLPKGELEQTLETLEMMAGEIGASVIVVKEIEVPAILATLAKRNGISNRNGLSTGDAKSWLLEDGYSTMTTETESETDFESTSGNEGEFDDLSVTVVLDKPLTNLLDSVTLFTMDSDEPREVADDERRPQTRLSVELEIYSVFKPRPTRKRVHNHPHHSAGGKMKRGRKPKSFNVLSSSNKNVIHVEATTTSAETKGLNRRQNRDRCREEKRNTSESRTTQSLNPEAESLGEVQSLTPLESLHVNIIDEPATIVGERFTSDRVNVERLDGDDDDDDVFAPLQTVTPSIPKFSASTIGESHLDVDPTAIGIVTGVLGGHDLYASGCGNEPPRLIVEVLVVRKMTPGEAFLDFSGFSLT